MKTKIILFVLASFLLWSLCSCVSNETANSDAVKQSEIYQSYSVTYDASDMELSATAFFRFGGSAGTTLNLVKPSSIKFNGVEMAMGKNILSGTFYESNQQTELSKGYTFVFTDTENKTYTNSISVEPLEIIEYPASINKGKGFTVAWTGKSVQNGERIYLTLEGTDMSSCTTSTDLVGATSINVNPEIMKDMKPGNANIILKREISNSLKEATHLGGSMTITYLTKKVATKIE